MHGHACVSEIGTQIFDEYVEKYAKIRVVLHRLHKTLADAEDEEWRNLQCAAQVADHYFMHNALAMHILFISINFMIIADLRTTLLDRISLSSLAVSTEQAVYCMPKQVNLAQGESTGGMCEMDILLLSSRVGAEFYGVLNSTKPLDLLAFEAFEVAARSVTGGIHFLQPRSAISQRRDMVIRDGRMWMGNNHDDSGIALVEFANMFHKLDVVDCVVYVSFDFTNHFKTESILNIIFSRDMTHLHKYCDEEYLFLDTDFVWTGLDVKLATKSKPAIFDLIIFNDEVELLLLRLEYLKPYVTTHVIVESETTFTGNPKPLHFLNNKHLFAEYNVTSFSIPLVATANLHVDDREVWNREYFSRNSLFEALETLHARDEDLILVSDVDEIAHPRALQNLIAIHSHAYVPDSHDSSSLHSTGYRSRIHKLHQKTYMYDFDCYLPRQGQTLSKTALTATTLGYAKQLFPDNNYDSLMTSVRLYQQSITPYAYEDVIAPGGWHLTFFGGVQRIKSKLASYSHRNIRRRYVSDAEGEKLDDYGAESEKFFTLVSKRISNGDQMDNRENEKCVNVELDDETAQLKQMWENIVVKLQHFQI